MASREFEKPPLPCPETRPPYSPELFVGREKETDLVVAQVKALARGEKPPAGVIHFFAEPGLGKTWFLAHLEAEISQGYPGVTSVKINLAQFDPRGLFLPEHLVLNAIGEEPTVFLIDNILSNDWETLVSLEEKLLGPLSQKNNVLIVFAEWGRAYPWAEPNLKSKSEFIDLLPFTPAETQRQLASHDLDAAQIEEIQALTHGHPRTNYLLSTGIKPAEALNLAINEFLQATATIPLYELRDYVETIFVLREFDEERMPPLLAAYHDDPNFLNWTYGQCRSIREPIIWSHLASWKAEVRAYVPNLVLRSLLNSFLKVSSPKDWRDLNLAAADFYDQWSRDYPKSSDRWEKESQYHRQLADKI